MLGTAPALLSLKTEPVFVVEQVNFEACPTGILDGDAARE
jgi:hypothetical protein